MTEIQPVASGADEAYVPGGLTGTLELLRKPDGKLYAGQCDPCVVFDESFLLAAWRHDEPEMSLELAGNGGVTGSVLRIDAAGRQVVYRITGRSADPDVPGWVGRWPD